MLLFKSFGDKLQGLAEYYLAQFVTLANYV